MPKKPLTPAQRGRLGGRKTAQKYGAAYMAEIGRRGARSLHERYEMQAVNLNDFALIDRNTGKVIALINGAPITSRRYQERTQGQ